MYVCICNAITDKQIRKAAEAGATDLWRLQAELGVATGCGSCKEVASEILHEVRQSARIFEPVLYTPAIA
jgi:bacterioferritin-associated ferredoxin